MAIDFADDTSVDEPEPTTEEKTVLDEFKDVVGGVEQSPDDEAGDEQPEDEQPETDEDTSESPEEESEDEQPEPPATPKAEGPSLAMQELAKLSGLPPQLVSIARDDQQLQEFVDLATNTTAPAEPEPDEPEFKLSLPEDEHPEDDPVRKEFTRLQSHFSEQLKAVKSQLQDATAKASSFEQQQQAAEQQRASQLIAEFDQAVDNLGVPAFGKTGELSPANFELRKAAFNIAQQSLGESPSTSMADIAKRVAEEFSLTPTTKTPTEKAAIREQSKRRLGSGPSKPASPGIRSEEEQLAEWLKTNGFKD